MFSNQKKLLLIDLDSLVWTIFDLTVTLYCPMIEETEWHIGCLNILH